MKLVSIVMLIVLAFSTYALAQTEDRPEKRVFASTEAQATCQTPGCCS